MTPGERYALRSIYWAVRAALQINAGWSRDEKLNRMAAEIHMMMVSEDEGAEAAAYVYDDSDYGRVEASLSAARYALLSDHDMEEQEKRLDAQDEAIERKAKWREANKPNG